jgi:hypothetical protein
MGCLLKGDVVGQCTFIHELFGASRLTASLLHKRPVALINNIQRIIGVAPTVLLISISVATTQARISVIRILAIAERDLASFYFGHVRFEGVCFSSAPITESRPEVPKRRPSIYPFKKLLLTHLILDGRITINGTEYNLTRFNSVRIFPLVAWSKHFP